MLQNVCAGVYNKKGFETLHLSMATKLYKNSGHQGSCIPMSWYKSFQTHNSFCLILSQRERERERERASPLTERALLLTHSQKSFSIVTLKHTETQAHMNWNRKVGSGPVTYVVLSSDPVSYVDLWLFVNKPGYGGETSILMKGKFLFYF